MRRMNWMRMMRMMSWSWMKMSCLNWKRMMSWMKMSCLNWKRMMN
jgi:hypothetical protein